MGSQCEECRRADLECDTDASGLSCSNCSERGFAHICLARPGIAPLKVASRTSICITYLKTFVAQLISLVSTPFVYIYNDKTLIYLRCLYLPFLLFLPVYYCSQASTVLDCAEDCKEEYDGWMGSIRAQAADRIVRPSTSSATLTNSGDDIPLMVIRTQDTDANVDTSDQGRAIPEPIRVPTETVSGFPSKPPPPPKVIKLKETWRRYLDSRIVEWKISATTACVFVAASPTIFQIPDASNDPITRSIAFFALCRAVSGIIYGPIFPIYFRTMRAKSAHFAMLWAQESKNSRDRFFRGQWIMLSLPAVATSWATISFIVAIFAFIWRTGSVADPSDWSSTGPGRRPMSIDLALVLRVIITSITVTDIVCMVWIWRVLRRYSIRVWRDEDGGDAFPESPRPHGQSGNLTP